MAVQLTFPGLYPVAEPATPLATPVTPLWGFPYISPRDRQQHARALGLAGEALCDSLLLRFGLLSLVPPDHLPYDRLIMTGGAQARLQVKTCAVPSGGLWCFTMRKGYQGSVVGTRPYALGDFDIGALVCLAANAVIFTTATGPWFRLTDHDVARAAADPRASLEEALTRIGISPTPTTPAMLPDAA